MTSEMRRLANYVHIWTLDEMTTTRAWPRLAGVRTYTSGHVPSLYSFSRYVTLFHSSVAPLSRCLCEHTFSHNTPPFLESCCSHPKHAQC